MRSEAERGLDPGSMLVIMCALMRECIPEAFARHVIGEETGFGEIPVR
jgi:hypothetical protein